MEIGFYPLGFKLFGQDAGRTQLVAELFIERLGRFAQQLIVEYRQYNVVRLGDIASQQPDGGIQPPAQAVAGHGRFFDLAANHHRQTIITPLRIKHALQREVRATDGFALLINVAQAFLAVEAMGTGNHT